MHLIAIGSAASLLAGGATGLESVVSFLFTQGF